MLNISNNKVGGKINTDKFASFRDLEGKKSGRVLVRLMIGLAFFFLITMFIPWTQNIRSAGVLTTLQPDQRPQTIHSVIAGRIEKWFVREGDYVQKGDTILYITEIKDQYWDPQLLTRTKQQLTAKEKSAVSYSEKAEALSRQIAAMKNARDMRIVQAENKLEQSRLQVVSDSIDYEAAKINMDIAEERYDRIKALFDQGLKSKTDLESRGLTLQKTRADLVAIENKLAISKNKVANNQLEIAAVKAKFQDDIAKTESERFSALSGQFDVEATISKLENEYSNYSVRKNLYYITAPQNGYVTKAIQSGLGETIKEGEEIVSIMPAAYDLAVAMYIKPIDLPLLDKGQHVRIQFDGWPAIVFSGWPNTSYGTYGGTVFAIDNFISANGMYRVLVSPDPNDHPWPNALRVGAGTKNMVLLKNVPVWYELWRKINGFPPDYYKGEGENVDSKKA